MSQEIHNEQLIQGPETYTHGYGEEFQRFHTARRAVDEAAFLVPHLRPGMRLLDCGCGPGSITVDLAEIIAPGETVGIDLAKAQLDHAQDLAAQRGVNNVRFELANVHDLPFPTASFDAVFAHNLLEHLREPGQALRETRRVLKPGGVIGVQDDDWGTQLLEPMTPVLEKALELLLRVAARNGGDFFYARHQKRLLREAGFVRVEGHAMARYYGTPERVQLFAATAARQLREPALVTPALEQGWADQDTLQVMIDAFVAWVQHPDAFRAVLCPAALGWAAE